MQKVIIIGAGLCGSMLAVRLAQRGYLVEVFEKRADIRKQTYEGGRSINLALSDRGIAALRKIGLESIVSREGIPMEGRMIHDIHGNESFFPYSGRSEEFINSISRGGLNKALVLAGEGLSGLNFHFNHSCLDVDPQGKSVEVRDDLTGAIYRKEADVVFGTDGAGSAVRNAMMKSSNRIRFDFQQSYLTHGYKELTIPAADMGGWRLRKNALHIWPRGDHMVIALPNLDGSFTVTLFQAFEGQFGLDALDADAATARTYFQTYYRDALDEMPDFDLDFRSNPSSSLGTIKCYPWAWEGFSLLMGDAAHAIVPFYGQGMNASFEDVAILDDMIDQKFESWSNLFEQFQSNRKPNADAIADLAVDNFYEMRDYSGDPVFQMKTRLEKELEQRYPNDYFSKYSLVTFREDIGYREAMLRGRQQDRILMEYCGSLEVGEQPDVEDALRIIQEAQ
jgi:kynurenine 3-monooxygenase